MRVAHITDLHVEVPPRLGQLFSKRALGAVNLYVFGRSAHFTRPTVEALVQSVVQADPALVVCTGDLTSTATEEEFAAARALLAPILDRFPFLVIPGNHDVYTSESVGRFARHFGEWSGGAFPSVTRMGGVDYVAVDVCRPDWLSRGWVPEAALADLDRCLGESNVPAVVLVHYPLRDRRGQPYGPATRNLENAAALEAILVRHPRVVAVLHGHEHHGYRTHIPREGAPILSLDPGASGYGYLPKRGRTAHFNLYEVDPEGAFAIERYAWDGRHFAPEVGGAYATGG